MGDEGESEGRVRVRGRIRVRGRMRGRGRIRGRARETMMMGMRGRMGIGECRFEYCAWGKSLTH